MNFFNTLPGFRKTNPGRERKILRLLPKALLIGTLVLALPSVLARFYPWSGTAVDIASRITTIDIYGISLVILHWTIVFTVAIGAFIVLVMKGPAYVADAYPLEDADHPDASPGS
ncbi:MAG: hypothetical protein Q7J47_19885 [Azoarcus sp.]|nr:hypothetical protein [Azoarcus sp.]